MRTAEKIEVLYPSNVSPRFVRRRLRLLLLRKTVRHRRLAALNALLIPFTLAAGIIPGPNVFLFWNAYRLLSHVFAERGGRRVLAAEALVTFTSSDELNEWTSLERRVSAPLDLAGACHIAERLRLPGLVEHLRRTGGLAGDSAQALVRGHEGVFVTPRPSPTVPTPNPITPAVPTADNRPAVAARDTLRRRLDALPRFGPLFRVCDHPRGSGVP